jgi:dipeptidase D
MQEHALRQHLAAWAGDHGLDHVTDAAGNLLIRKPASPGREGRPGVILQGHLDMVCQANDGITHDFTRDPIRPVVRDGWLVADDTTLGADNGIGVSLALAALEDETLAHPALEALFTIDEEAGMGGAHGLAAGLLRGERMLNLDTEGWGEFYLGCAGGCDVGVHRSCRVEAVPPGYQGLRLRVSGLVGGHSGMDIHLGRGNANKLLVRLLRLLEQRTDLRVAAFAGGTARNALPREAWAILAVPKGDVAAVERTVADQQAVWRGELAGVDDGVTLAVRPVEIGGVISASDQASLLAALHAAPYGVQRMSADFAGVVETSNNLGVMGLADGVFSASLMVRSLRDSGAEVLADQIVGLFSLAGCQVDISGGYPGWTPNPHSPLLALCRQVFHDQFQAAAATKVIHAGLECGVIGAKYPHLDTVSFGPTICGAHAPGERVQIASVGDAWRLLTAILAAM